MAIDTSDTADIAATYTDAGGGYRNGGHISIDGGSERRRPALLLATGTAARGV